ncbi:MAG: T9SS C-terminal target domain-containing protein [Calditrichaeota bacterium]|nr:MAG: T9SS C-terminal target domain-containing protein [Calditrichota bacterium]
MTGCPRLILWMLGGLMWAVFSGAAMEPGNAKASGGQRENRQSVRIPEKITQTLLNVNRLSAWTLWNGKTGNDPFSGKWGTRHPRGSVGVVRTDGIVWAGYSRDGISPALRAGGSSFQTGLLPGRILPNGEPQDPAHPEVRIYRIRQDYATASDGELAQDVSELLNIPLRDVTQDHINWIREQYAWDWNHWPGDLGAPFVDVNRNGSWDPGIDEPGLQGADQVLWYVTNDLDSLRTIHYTGAPPLGVELQVTMWAYKTGGFLDHVHFRRYRIINKSGAPIDSMYLGYWADVDLGDFDNDFVGCDSVLGLAYVYNGYTLDAEYDLFGWVPGSFGYLLLQGPVVPSPGDTAIFDFRRLPDHRNLPMTSFGYDAHGDQVVPPPVGRYEGTLAWYNWLRGYQPTPDLQNPIPYVHGSGLSAGRATRFPLNGDPVSDPLGHIGDIDGIGNNYSESDRKILMSTGPFFMQPGDTQEIVLACVGGFFPDAPHHRASIATLRNRAALTGFFYGVDFKFPRVRYSLVHPNPGVTEVQVRMNLQNYSGVYGVRLDFRPQVGSEPGFVLMLYDDGQHEDSLAGDGIWANSVTIANRRRLFRADLTLQYAAGTLVVPFVLEEMLLRGLPEFTNFHIVWENGPQDGQINTGETVRLRFDVRNTDPLFEINSLTIDKLNPGLREQQITFPGSIPPGQIVSGGEITLRLTAPAQGDSLTYPIHLRYADTEELREIRFPIHAWNPPAVWGDTLEVISISGPTDHVRAIVADPFVLTGHTYRIEFFEDTGTGDILWRLIDRTAGVVRLDSMQRAPGSQWLHPVVDGIIYQVFERIADFLDFQVISNAGGVLNPPESAALDSVGFPVAASPTERQQVGPAEWLIHTGDNGSRCCYGDPDNPVGDNFLGRTTRNGANWPELVGYDFEWRFTGTSWTWDVFVSGSFFTVPFEFWNIGRATPDDTTDDYRMVPIILDVDENGAFGLMDSSDHTGSIGNDDPFTDWIYWYNPAGHTQGHPTGQAAYLAAEDSMRNGTYTGFHVVEVMARMVLINWNGGNPPNQALPEPGTIFRISTYHPNLPVDTLEVVSPPPVSISRNSFPARFYLYPNYPNPFNPETRIEFDLPHPARTKLEIFNLLGQRVNVLLDRKLPPGKHTVVWKGKNQAGQRVASGIYFYRLKAENYVKTRKMVLIR